MLSTKIYRSSDRSFVSVWLSSSSSFVLFSADKRSSLIIFIIRVRILRFSFNPATKREASFMQERQRSPWSVFLFFGPVLLDLATEVERSADGSHWPQSPGDDRYSQSNAGHSIQLH